MSDETKLVLAVAIGTFLTIFSVFISVGLGFAFLKWIERVVG